MQKSITKILKLSIVTSMNLCFIGNLTANGFIEEQPVHPLMRPLPVSATYIEKPETFKPPVVAHSQNILAVDTDQESHVIDRKLQFKSTPDPWQNLLDTLPIEAMSIASLFSNLYDAVFLNLFDETGKGLKSKYINKNYLNNVFDSLCIKIIVGALSLSTLFSEVKAENNTSTSGGLSSTDVQFYIILAGIGVSLLTGGCALFQSCYRHGITDYNEVYGFAKGACFRVFMCQFCCWFCPDSFLERYIDFNRLRASAARDQAQGNNPAPGTTINLVENIGAPANQAPNEGLGQVPAPHDQPNIGGPDQHYAIQNHVIQIQPNVTQATGNQVPNGGGANLQQPVQDHVINMPAGGIQAAHNQPGDVLGPDQDHVIRVQDHNLEPLPPLAPLPPVQVI